jgi:hypothetical protein
MLGVIVGLHAISDFANSEYLKVLYWAVGLGSVTQVSYLGSVIHGFTLMGISIANLDKDFTKCAMIHTISSAI